MTEEIFLQHWIFTRFALPFLLVFILLYAILEKTKLIGDKHQINAIISFVIAALFVGVAYPTLVISNLILFLTIALVVVFVALLIWGFISGGENSFKLPDSKGLKITVFILVLVVVAIAVIWATGAGGQVSGSLFGQDWSSSFWLNLSFIVLIAVALALVLKSSGSSGNSG